MNLENGMNNIHFNVSGSVPFANIVFIHGLFGHPWRTWADEAAEGRRKPYWPKDLLAHEVGRDARVYSYGYDADVTASASLNTVLHHGTNLLNDLASLEVGSLAPLIFIVHSLGGLVLKEALNQSANSSDDRLKSVVTNTHGIIFLGTPHRGSASASYGKIAFTMAKVFSGQSSNTKLLRALERDSEVLERISRAFYATWDKYPNMRVCSFHEEKEMRKLGLFRMRIVPPESARIGHVREELGSIPEDHRYMAKFKKPADTGYIRVMAVIHRWIRNITAQDDREDQQQLQECLDSLNDPESRTRILQVDPQHSGTFEWLFSDQVPFTKWLADSGKSYQPVFWMTGKPGSGKSTCMRFAMQDPRLLQLLPRGQGTPIGYFFHLRGKNKAQKSMHGMLLELLYQILLQFPRTLRYVRDEHKRLQTSQRAKKPVWAKEDLRRCIEKIVVAPTDYESRSQSESGRLVLFIDALDENAETSENGEVLDFIHRLSDTYQDFNLKVRRANLVPPWILKICLASRPWPLYQKSLANNPRIPSFAIHEHTRADIERFTISNLTRALNVSTATSRQHETLRDLSDIVIEKAHGVFVWVRFVVRDLCRHLTDGSSMGTIRNFISALPDELGELYEYTARRIPVDYRLEAAVAFRVLLCSLRPLSLQALQCAMMACIEATSSRTLSERISGEALKSWLASRSDGLVELVVDYASLGPFKIRLDQPRSETYETVWKVQFIHQTVQEFVHIGMPGLDLEQYPEFWQHLDGNFLIYRAIAAEFPPPQPLIGLARDLFLHLREVDQLLDQETSSFGHRYAWEVPDLAGALYGRKEHLNSYLSRRGWLKEICKDGQIPYRSSGGASLVLRRRMHAIICLRSIFIKITAHHYYMSEEDLSYFMTSEDLANFGAMIPKQLSAFQRRHARNSAVYYAALIYGDLLQWQTTDLPKTMYFDLQAMVALGPRAVETTAARRVRMLSNVHPGFASRYLNDTEPRDMSPSLRGRVPELLLETRGSLVGHLTALEHHSQVDDDGRLRLVDALLADWLARVAFEFRTMEAYEFQRDQEPFESRVTYSMELGEYCARFKSEQWVQMCSRHNRLREGLDVTVRKVIEQTDEGADVKKAFASIGLLACSMLQKNAMKACYGPVPEEP